MISVVASGLLAALIVMGCGAADGDPRDPPSGDQPTPKPNAQNTGPRLDITRTLTPDAAIAELRQTGRLSGVLIDGLLRLSGTDGCGWVIEDSVIHAGMYGIQAYVSLDPFDCPSGDRPVFDHVRIIGRGARGAEGDTSALFYGHDTILRHADLYGGVDGLKVSSRVEVFASYVHGLHHPEGSHVDAIQIRSGSDSLLHWNFFDARVAYGTNVGANGSGGLQTGSVSGPIERIVFRDNWWNGGHYTIRMGGRDEPIDYQFRNNKHGRDFTYGPTTGCSSCPFSGGGVRYDDSNVWEDTGAPVL